MSTTTYVVVEKSEKYQYSMFEKVLKILSANVMAYIEVPP